MIHIKTKESSQAEWIRSKSMHQLFMKWKQKPLVLFAAGLGMSVIIFISFVYADVTETTRHGITFWNVLFQGNLNEFYVQNENVMISEHFGISRAAIYDFPLYLLFAIWDFPLWIYERVSGGYALDTWGGLLYAKSISIPFLIGIIYYLKKIGCKLKGQAFEQDLSVLMFISSALFLVPVLIMGQYDAPALLFILIGLYGYIDNNDKVFYGWFALALTFKLFALFVFIPLVLLREKQMKSVCVSLLKGCSFFVFVKIIQRLFFVPNQLETSDLSGHFLSFLFQSQVGFVYGSISLFFSAFLMVCMYCYFIQKPEEEEMGRWAVYVSFMGLSVFFVTSLTHPQWSLLLLPFSILLVCCDEKRYVKIGLWIDTIFSSGLLLAEVMYYSWVFNIKTSSYMMAGRLFYNGEKDAGYSVRDFLAEHMAGFPMEYLQLIGGSIFTAGILFFLYWAHPKSGRKGFAELEISMESIIVVRFLLMVSVSGMLLKIMW